MRPTLNFLLLAALAPTHVLSQQIWDAFQTTIDQTMAFTPYGPSPGINFATPGTTESTVITVNDATKYQNMSGFGATLTDSSATVLYNLKQSNLASYQSIISAMFSTSTFSAALNYIRVPIGATDFSATVYSLEDCPYSTDIDMSKVPTAVTTVLTDILAVNAFLKVHLVPFSPPAWMKDSGTMKGGSLLSTYTAANQYPTYLLKVIQGFIAAGYPVHAISIQNEPLHDNPTYPTCYMTPSVEAGLAGYLKTLLTVYGINNVKIVGSENNWNEATGYAADLMTANATPFSGVAFHCYNGTVSDQSLFHAAYPTKEVYFTECTGLIGGDWASGLAWSSENLWIGSPNHWSKTGLMWNIALNYTGGPKLPGTSSCTTPACRGLVNINPDGSYFWNAEFYGMAQASKAAIPHDANGPFGQRINSTVTGVAPLKVTAYETRRTSVNEWNRYSIVVLNSGESSVTASIAFRGAQASYTFPPGVTTLWWFAAVL